MEISENSGVPHVGICIFPFPKRFSSPNIHSVLVSPQTSFLDLHSSGIQFWMQWAAPPTLWTPEHSFFAHKQSYLFPQHDCGHCLDLWLTIQFLGSSPYSSSRLPIVLDSSQHRLEDRIFSGACRNRTRGNDFKLNEGRFRLDTRH